MDGIPRDLAVGLIETWMRFRVQEMNLDVLRGALRVREVWGYSFWDSAIIAAALTLGCDRLYTEELAEGQVIEGLTVINPFR